MAIPNAMIRITTTAMAVSVSIVFEERETILGIARIIMIRSTITKIKVNQVNFKATTINLIK